MGRELKRVPMDFEYPLHKVWIGYINPYHIQECPYCEGSGLNKETRKISNDWYTHLRTDGKEGWMYDITQDEVEALIEHGRLMDFTRVPINEEQKKVVEDKIKNGGNSWLPYDNGYMPTSDEVNKWARKNFGHDSMNQWICVETRAKRLGVYGECKYCNGAGEIGSKEDIERRDNWESYEPPIGDGYQLWETTSEGSPVSPVFGTLKDLCEWCEDNATTFGSFKTSAQKWYEMLSNDFVCHKEGNSIFI